MLRSIALACVLGFVVGCMTSRQSADDGWPMFTISEPLDVPWVSGTVRDRVGRPIAGVRVCVVALFNYTSSTKGRSAEATTASDGTYTVAGPRDGPAGDGLMLFTSRGSAPILRRVALPLGTVTEVHGNVAAWKPKPPPVVDVTAGMPAGRLDVIATAGNGPANGAIVEVRRPGVSLGENGSLEYWFDAFAHDESSDAVRRIEAVVRPRAVAGADGIAHFTALAPGQYDVDAVLLKADSLEGRSLVRPVQSRRGARRWRWHRLSRCRCESGERARCTHRSPGERSTSASGWSDRTHGRSLPRVWS